MINRRSFLSLVAGVAGSSAYPIVQSIPPSAEDPFKESRGVRLSERSQKEILDRIVDVSMTMQFTAQGIAVGPRYPIPADWWSPAVQGKSYMKPFEVHRWDGPQCQIDGVILKTPEVEIRDHIKVFGVCNPGDSITISCLMMKQP